MVPRRPIPLTPYSVHIGLRWLIVEANGEPDAVHEAIDQLGLPPYAMPDDIRCKPATDDELARFAALSTGYPASIGPVTTRRRWVKGVTGRRHVDPGTGPLFEQDGTS